ncbi:MAG: hypothetical protein L0211_06765 [Planctomycetaceae bacterium]|nr:hypothetical protein [Planctomycetaceae bacterium]
MDYYVGWDVGGWNCSSRSASQDALAILSREEQSFRVMGSISRGPIRKSINRSSKLHSILNEECGTSIQHDDSITIAIDTPLGFPLAVQSLISGGDLPPEVPDDYSENPYLYRVTERWLFSRNFPTLSAIKDMIGSQATKGMHALRKLGLTTAEGECGVWRNGRIVAIECYPTTCKRSENVGCAGSATVQRLFDSLDDARHLAAVDQIDAVHCALIAYLFAADKSQLVGPTHNAPASEGWIWTPRDAIGRTAQIRR